MDEPGTSQLSVPGSLILPRQCSVRACTNVLVPGEANKMCEVCRGRHRIYATTKRAKRKLEKAAMVGQGSIFSIDPLSSGAGMWINEDVDMDVTVGDAVNGEESNQSYASILPAMQMDSPSPPWDAGIDPRLFQSSLLHNSSSELAGALAYAIPPPTAISPLVGIATSFDDALAEPAMVRMQSIEPTAINTAALMDSPMSSSFPQNPMEDQESASSSIQTEFSPVAGAEQALPGATRVCSVRGCKTIMQAHYEYKMCEPCRGRYRKYGTTKRAKWKAERVAFDRELSELRKVEDARRDKEGLVPLDESPEELRNWELSIIDEQVLLPATVSELLEATMKSTGLTDVDAAASLLLSARHDGLVGASGSMIADKEAILKGTPPSLAELQRKSGNTTPMRVMQPTGIDTPYSVSPYTSQELLANDASLAAFIAPSDSNNQVTSPEAPQPDALPFTLPTRMCTVSHCHKILPGFYRYKRCEQHRLQNRYHSQLKRVREKVVKSFNHGDVAKEDGEGECRDDPAVLSTIAQAGSAVVSSNGDGNEASSDPATSRPSVSPKFINTRSKEKKSLSVCAAAGCYNFMSPEVRWRTCETCRAKLRAKRKMSGDAPVLEGVGIEDGSQSGQPRFIIMKDLKDIEDVFASEESAELAPTTTNHTNPPSVPSAQEEPTSTELPISMDIDVGSSSLPVDPTSSSGGGILSPPKKPLTFRSYTAGSISSAIDRVVAGDSNASTERAFSDVWKVARTLVDGEKENAAVTSNNDGRSSSTASISTAPASTKSVKKTREKNAIARPSRPPASGSVDQARPPQDQIPSYPCTPSIHTSLPYPYYMPYLYPPYAYPIGGAASTSNSRQNEPSFNHFYPFAVPGPYPYHPYAAIPPTGYSYLPPRYMPGVYDPSFAQSSSAVYQHAASASGSSQQSIAINNTVVQAARTLGEGNQNAEAEEAVQPELRSFSEAEADHTARSQRPCINRNCKRMVPSEGKTVLCPRCVLRFKKHQARTKVRLKLEPKKPCVAGRGVKSSE